MTKRMIKESTRNSYETIKSYDHIGTKNLVVKLPSLVSITGINV